ncbi:MAG: DUF6504 family protein [Phycisphaerae bacterium]|nr:hypothetical protein [Phycisphaerae bacterium]MCZ2401582.1 DUF6504 family protein [Phycisphaerae bacterium]
MNEFISQPLMPLGPFDTTAMGCGLPGAPAGFVWSGVAYRIVTLLDTWKESAPVGGRPGGERYLRRHWFRLRMSDGAVWTVYFLRQTPRSGSARRRWFLYEVAAPVTQA